MKLRYLTLAFSGLLFASASPKVDLAKTDSSHRYAVSADALSWVAGNFNLEFEMSLTDKLALNVPVSFGIEKSILNNTFFRGTYFAPQVGLKYYITGEATRQGFYVNPLLGLGIMKLQDARNPTKSTAALLSYGFYFGYAINLCHGLWLDSHLGFNNIATPFSIYTQSVPFRLNADIGVMVGYNW